MNGVWFAFVIFYEVIGAKTGSKIKLKLQKYLKLKRLMTPQSMVGVAPVKMSFF